MSEGYAGPEFAELNAQHRALKDEKAKLLSFPKEEDGWPGEYVRDAQERALSMKDWVASRLDGEKAQRLAEIDEELRSVAADRRCLAKHGCLRAEHDKRAAAAGAKAAVAAMSEGEREALREALGE